MNDFLGSATPIMRNYVAPVAVEPRLPLPRGAATEPGGSAEVLVGLWRAWARVPLAGGGAEVGVRGLG